MFAAPEITKSQCTIRTELAAGRQAAGDHCPCRSAPQARLSPLYAKTQLPRLSRNLNGRIEAEPRFADHANIDAITAFTQSQANLRRIDCGGRTGMEGLSQHWSSLGGIKGHVRLRGHLEVQRSMCEASSSSKSRSRRCLRKKATTRAQASRNAVTAGLLHRRRGRGP